MTGTPDIRYFLNPESVSIHLFCSICQEVFSEPQRAPCGHSFCKACILAWLEQSKTCPEDRRTVRAQDLHHDFILENIIGDQMVACPFRKWGCEFVAQLQLLSAHQKRCDFNPSNLPHFLLPSSSEQPSTSGATNTPGDVDSENADVLPELAKPSLKMRLFKAGGEKRELLCTMFEHKDSTNVEKVETKTPKGKTKKRSAKRACIDLTDSTT